MNTAYCSPEITRRHRRQLPSMPSAIAVMPFKNVTFHGNNLPCLFLHCRRALFLHARSIFQSQKGENKIIKIAAHGHGSAHERCLHYVPSRRARARPDPSEPRQSLVGVKLYPPHKHSLGKVFKGTSLKKAWHGVRSIAKC